MIPSIMPDWLASVLALYICTCTVIVTLYLAGCAFLWVRSWRVWHRTPKQPSS